LDNDINAKAIRGFKLREAIYIYCPVGDGGNNPSQYVLDISRWIGIPPDSVLLKVLTGPVHVAGPWTKAPPPGPPRPNWEDPEGLLKMFQR
jgi:hypothetical protein